MAGPTTILFCWSGGKDSAMALHELLQRKEVKVAGLLTTVTEGFERVSMHGVRRELLQRQAESIGLPLKEVRIPPQCVNPIYEERMETAMRAACQQGTRRVAFGDIFLEDLRVYREKNLAKVGMEAIFPIWKRDTRELSRAFVKLGFKARAVCIDPRVLDRSFAGRDLDQRFFDDLPENADPCGENGEFHSFVYDGPIFRKPVRCKTGEVVERDSFVFCDLLPEEEVRA
ncbi:MAG TPA: diphthine--ammonia ligase [Candidatus Acidoferrum sp.]|nr:diphthine--ammonia ligase [Candidatus Acidoferrum sp.]